MQDDVEKYPLTWPAGRPRTPTNNRMSASFGTRKTNSRGYPVKEDLTIAEGRMRVEYEVEMLSAKSLVISSNLVLNRDGTVRSSQREPDDCGVAVYFTLDGRPIAFAWY